jgi:hypothetical protein
MWASLSTVGCTTDLLFSLITSLIVSVILPLVSLLALLSTVLPSLLLQLKVVCVADHAAELYGSRQTQTSILHGLGPLRPAAFVHTTLNESGDLLLVSEKTASLFLSLPNNNGD